MSNDPVPVEPGEFCSMCGEPIKSAITLINDAAGDTQIVCGYDCASGVLDMWEEAEGG